jgi:acyl carrier protein
MTNPATESDTRSETEIRELTRTIIAQLAPNKAADCTPEQHLADELEFHSLALLELAFALEDEFNLAPIDQETAQQITSVGAVQDFVVSQVCVPST